MSDDLSQYTVFAGTYSRAASSTEPQPSAPFVYTHLPTGRSAILRPIGDRLSDDLDEIELHASAIMRLNAPHPNILEVYELLADLDDEPTLLAYLDDIDGSILEHAERRVASLKEKIERIKPALVALEWLHRNGRVHRDVCVDDIIVTRDEGGATTTKILAPASFIRVASHKEPLVTRISFRRSSHVAPERVTGSSRNDPASDIWSFGIALYILLTGALPYEAESLADLAAKVTEDGPIPLEEVAPWLPPSLRSLVQCCLRREPSERPTAKQLLEEFEALEIDEPDWAPPDDLSDGIAGELMELLAFSEANLDEIHSFLRAEHERSEAPRIKPQRPDKSHLSATHRVLPFRVSSLRKDLNNSEHAQARTHCLIGSSTGNDIIFTDTDISDFHCKITSSSEGILIRDLGSTNGTYVNSVRIIEAFIEDEATIRLGHHQLILSPIAEHQNHTDLSNVIIASTVNNPNGDSWPSPIIKDSESFAEFNRRTKAERTLKYLRYLQENVGPSRTAMAEQAGVTREYICRLVHSVVSYYKEQGVDVELDLADVL